MEFLNKIKRSEIIQMVLKGVIGVLLGIIVVFFMEAMIYNIYFNALEKSSSITTGADHKTVLYVDEVAENEYQVYMFANGKARLNITPKFATSDMLNKDKNYTEEGLAKLYVLLEQDTSIPDFKVYKRQPNCFDLGSINGVHYAVIVVFLLGIAGVFAWRISLILKEYKKLEKKFKKTGKIFA